MKGIKCRLGDDVRMLQCEVAHLSAAHLRRVCAPLYDTDLTGYRLVFLDEDGDWVTWDAHVDATAQHLPARLHLKWVPPQPSARDALTSLAEPVMQTLDALCSLPAFHMLVRRSVLQIAQPDQVGHVLHRFQWQAEDFATPPPQDVPRVRSGAASPLPAAAAAAAASPVSSPRPSAEADPVGGHDGAHEANGAEARRATDDDPSSGDVDVDGFEMIDETTFGAPSDQVAATWSAIRVPQDTPGAIPSPAAQARSFFGALFSKFSPSITGSNPADWQTKLIQLERMGFQNHEKNMKVLVRHRGNMDSAVKELIADMNQATVPLVDAGFTLDQEGDSSGEARTTVAHVEDDADDPE